MPKKTGHKNVTLELRISRMSGGRIDDDKMIRFSANDVSSGVNVIEADMTREQLADMMTGSSCKAECEFIADAGIVGMKHESKTERVFIPKILLDRKPSQYYGSGKYESAKTDAEQNRVEQSTRSRKAWAREALVNWEVDGWHERGEELFNGHNLVQTLTGEGAIYKVVFFRTVDPETGEPYESAVAKFLRKAVEDGVITKMTASVMLAYHNGELESFHVED